MQHNCSRAGLNAQGLDVPIPTQVAEYCRPDGMKYCRVLIVQNQFYPQTKEALAIFTKNYLR
jgi:hypothetical protein